MEETEIKTITEVIEKVIKIMTSEIKREIMKLQLGLQNRLGRLHLTILSMISTCRTSNRIQEINIQWVIQMKRPHFMIRLSFKCQIEFLLKVVHLVTHSN